MVFLGSMVFAAWGFREGIDRALWVFVVSAVNLFVIAALEWLLPRDRGATLFRDRQTPRDIGHGLLVASLGRTATGPLVVGVVAALSAVAPVSINGLEWPDGWPLVGQVAFALLLWSFVGYWSHRLFHRVPRLWWFHAVHHDTPRMHVLKGNRIHFGEDVTRQFFNLLPLYVLGAPTLVLVWISLWNNFEGALAHANVEFGFPKIAHWVLPTPQNHLVHHARARELQDSNFGGVTPVWDVLFGTFRHPARNPVTAVGIENSPVPERFVEQIVFPLRRARVPAD
jgi:sterol desaturase/sphingolipid hydroxylase (fatty acid hydroxylase superfamily)